MKSDKGCLNVEYQGGTMKTKPMPALLLALALGLAGAQPSAAWAKSIPTGAAPQTPSLEYLQGQVRHQLVMLPYYSVFDNLEYKVDGYTVELSGQVARPTLKSEAENVVKRIEGVQKVVNKIEVLPLSPNDDRIRLAVYRAIYRSSQLDRYSLQPVPSIHIIVKNGNVTLKGVVANEMDRNIAFLKANGVFGAFSVTNDLRVEKNG
jgi:hyperosmotically inducible periplasmic protein